MYWGEVSKYRSQIYGCSILWIVIFHLYEAFFEKLNFNWISSVVFNAGYIGVDIFLFLSGVSMYYSMKKYEQLNLRNILQFYKKRFAKILKVYLLFCIPFLVFRDIMTGHNVQKFVKQLFFVDYHVSSFWFIMAILICYLMYPCIEKLLRANRRKIIWGIISGYVLGLAWLAVSESSFFEAYEVLLTRIPIFIIGALYAERVRRNEKVSPKEFGCYIAAIFLKSPVAFAMTQLHINSGLIRLTERLFLGWMGIGILFLILMGVKVYENTFLDHFLKKIGTVTLEIYVFHIAFRALTLAGLQSAGIDMISYHEIIPYAMLYIPLSVFGGYVLALILKKINLNRRKKNETV